MPSQPPWLTPPRGRIADLFGEYQDAMEVDASETSEAKELRQIDAKIARIETAIEAGLPFDRDRLLALHDRRAELEKMRADSSPRKYGRGEVFGLLEKAAQMDSERAIDVTVHPVPGGFVMVA